MTPDAAVTLAEWLRIRAIVARIEDGSTPIDTDLG